MIGKLVVFWILVFVIKKIASIIASYSQFSNGYLIFLQSLCSSIDRSIKVSFGTISYEFRTGNKDFSKLFLGYKATCRRFLNFGTIIMLIGNILTPFLVLHTLILVISTETISKWHSPVRISDATNLLRPSNILTPIIPGLNFPWEHAFEYWMCTFLVIIVHELGHAFAAIVENISIMGVGVFFAVIMPGAYVDIEESYELLNIDAKLRVICGGVWSNVSFSILCFFGLLFVPQILSLSLYNRVDGAIFVREISPNSIFKSFSPGDRIIGINECRIYSPYSFHLTTCDRFASYSSMIHRDIVLPVGFSQSMISSYGSLAITINDSLLDVQEENRLQTNIGVCHPVSMDNSQNLSSSINSVSPSIYSSMSCCRDTLNGLASGASKPNSLCGLYARQYSIEGILSKGIRGNDELDSLGLTCMNVDQLNLHYCSSNSDCDSLLSRRIQPKRLLLEDSISTDENFPALNSSSLLNSSSPVFDSAFHKRFKCVFPLTDIHHNIFAIHLANHSSILLEYSRVKFAAELVQYLGEFDVKERIKYYLSYLSHDWNRYCYQCLLSFPDKLVFYLWLLLQV